MISVTSIVAPFVKTTNILFQVRSYLSTLVIPKEEKIRVGNWNINYLKVGNGPHYVLCMPGALGTIWTNFRPQVEGLDRSNFTVIAWDPPGFGKSRPPERDFPPNYNEENADFAFNFMKALQIPQYSLLGWSNGSAASIILAAKHPMTVKKLILWGAKTFILPHELECHKKLKDTKSWSKTMRQPMIEAYGEELLCRYWARWVDSVEALYHVNNGDICSAYLKDIKCPTFILGGAEDPIADVTHVSYLHSRIDGSRTFIYSKGSHNIHLQYAEDFNKRIQDFLTS